jgi:biopolymer transport protein ExbD
MTVQPRTRPITPAVLLAATIDVLFLLLFFLLLGSNWLAVPGLSFKQSETVFMPGGFSEPVVVAVRSDNRILLQGRLLSSDNWPEEMRNFFRGLKKHVLVVAAPEAGTKTTYSVLSLLSELEQQVAFSSGQDDTTEPAENILP